MSAFPTFRHVESRCPQCDYKMDSSTHVQGDKATPPEAGDYSVCINCGQVLVYEDECRMRKATGRELGLLMTANPEGWAAIEKAQMFIRQRGRFA